MPLYEVQPGDTLYDIAQKTTGDGERWREIFKDNSDQISDPGLIHPGQVLAIRNDNPQSDVVARNVPSEPRGQRVPAPPSIVGPRAAPLEPSAPYTPTTNSNAPIPPSLAYNQDYGSVPQLGNEPKYRPPQVKATRGLDYTPPYNPQGYIGPQQGPQRYTLAQARQDHPQPAYMQVGQPFRAQMGVTVTPPIQQGVNSWQDRIAQTQQNGGVPSGYHRMPDGSIMADSEMGGSKPQVSSGMQNPNNPYRDTSQRAQAHPLAPVQPSFSPYYTPSVDTGIENPTIPSAQPAAVVTWPAPPGVMQQDMQRRANAVPAITPSAYQGRFTDNAGNFQPPNALTGYMGRPKYGPYQPPMQPQQTFIPTVGTQAQPQPQPRTVVVINQDGSQLIWDASTQAWTKVGGTGR